MAAKYGQDRHQPTGEWVQATTVVPVFGIQYRRDAAFAFAAAARKAEVRGWMYGVKARPEPTNAVDPNAIKVVGFAEQRGFLRRPRVTDWHIGYLDRDTAADITGTLVAEGVPISAELYSIYESDDFLDVKIIILAPPGHSLSTRIRKSKRNT